MNIERPISNPSTIEDPEEGKSRHYNVAFVRRIAMIGVPLIVVLGGVGLYVVAGRYVSTENSYVKANWASVSPAVSGDVIEVFAEENEMVKKDQPILQLTSEVYEVNFTAAAAQMRSARAAIQTDKAQYLQKVQELAIAETDAKFAQRAL